MEGEIKRMEKETGREKKSKKRWMERRQWEKPLHPSVFTSRPPESTWTIIIPSVSLLFPFYSFFFSVMMVLRHCYSSLPKDCLHVRSYLVQKNNLLAKFWWNQGSNENASYRIKVLIFFSCVYPCKQESKTQTYHDVKMTYSLRICLFCN